MNLSKIAVRVIVAICLSWLFVSSAAAQSRDEAEIFALVNRERVRARLGALNWDDKAANVARNYSRRMAREHFFDHFDPEGRTVIERASKIRWEKIGENLFMGDDVPDLAVFSVRGWMHSPSHRQNILDREWSATGVGIWRTNDGQIFVTQIFLSP